VRATEVEEANGIAINIGSGRKISVNNLLKKITRLTGKEDTAVVKKERYAGDFPHTLANIELAKKILDWRPTVDLERGLVKFIDWSKREASVS
jgi:UDP-glucose 4-epimerase